MSRLLEQCLSPAHTTLLASYVKILSEMTVLDESRAVLLTSPLFFSTLCSLLRCGEASLLLATVQLLTRACEDVDGCGDRVATRCLQDDSLSQLVHLLQSEGSVETKVGKKQQSERQVSVVKFLAVLVYSVRSLATRVKVTVRERHERQVIDAYRVSGFMEVCETLRQRYARDEKDPLTGILGIAREVMEISITDEDLATISLEDVAALARSGGNDRSRRDHSTALHRRHHATAVSPAAAATRAAACGGRGGTRRLDESGGVLRESGQRESAVGRPRDAGDDGGRLAAGERQMLKKKSGEQEAEQAARAKALETLRERCNDLEVQYNRSCCREQELLETIKRDAAERAELQKKLALLVRTAGEGHL